MSSPFIVFSVGYWPATQECGIELLSKTGFDIISTQIYFVYKVVDFRGMKMDKTIPLLHCRDYPKWCNFDKKVQEDCKIGKINQI